DREVICYLIQLHLVDDVRRVLQPGEETAFEGTVHVAEFHRPRHGGPILIGTHARRGWNDPDRLALQIGQRVQWKFREKTLRSDAMKANYVDPLLCRQLLHLGGRLALRGKCGDFSRLARKKKRHVEERHFWDCRRKEAGREDHSI